MWPFRKKYPPRNEIKLAEELTFFHGEQNGKPLVARFNARAKALIGHPEFTHQASIAVVLNTPAENGLTTDDENNQLRGIEAQLRDLLQQDNESLQVGAITTNGVKEYVFYTANPDGAKAKFEQFRARVSDHQLRFTIQPDAEWTVFKQYVR